VSTLLAVTVSHGPDGQVRYVEVKGRAGAGAVEISENEKQALRMIVGVICGEPFG